MRFFSLPSVLSKMKSISGVYRRGSFRRRNFGRFWRVALLASATYRNRLSNINHCGLIPSSSPQKASLKFTIPLQLAAKTTTTHSLQKDPLLISIFLPNWQSPCSCKQDSLTTKATKATFGLWE